MSHEENPCIAPGKFPKLQGHGTSGYGGICAAPGRQMRYDPLIAGQDELAVERFQDDTRHMIVFDVLDSAAPIGSPGERIRLFLSDKAYAKALAAQERGEIRIKKHAAVIEGHILPDRKRKRRH